MGRATNFCGFSGNVGKEPELQYTPSGTAKVTFSVAVNDGYMKDGAWQDKTTWVNLTAWGQTAEYIQRTIGKGDLVSVTSQYETFQYERDGETRYGHSFKVTNIDRLRKSQNRDDAYEPVGEGSFSGTQVADDDIPF